MKCPECKNGRWYDSSHHSSRKCNTCSGTGVLDKDTERKIEISDIQKKVFQLTKKQAEKFVDWKETLGPEPQTAIGGRFSFTFCQTSIGVMIEIYDCVTGQTLDLNDDL